MYRNQSWAMPPLNNCAVSSTLLASFLPAETWKRRECVSCFVSLLFQHFSLNGDLLENYHKTLVSWTGIDEISLITVNCSLQERGREGCKERREERATGRQGSLTSTLTSHLPPWARHHAIFILSQSASEPARQSNRQDSPQRCFSFFSSQSAPQPHRLVSALTDRSVSVKLCSDYQNLIWGGLLTNPPTHSKSKCAIKNAHLTSSSRLPNAYASYLRDQEEWYCKRYRIFFIRYTIQISSGGGWWVPPSRAAVQIEPWESVKEIQDLLKDTHLDAG